MKKVYMYCLVFVFVTAMVSLAGAECTSIQDGTLLTSTGEVITTGYDTWGYNYGAHIFNGGYCDAYRDASWCEEWEDVDLIMKWNDAWLSNKDCDGDGKLDRHYGNDSYIGSGAWLTNHQSGKVGVNGKMRKWTYLVKIIAVDSDAQPCSYDPNYWCTADGIEIGPVIWGSFAIVQQVLNDPSIGEHGILYKSAVDPGLGSLQ